MAAVVAEEYLSRGFTLGQTPGRELVYIITDAADEDEAEAALLATAPAAYQGLALESVSAEPLGYDSWKGYARYSRLDAPEYTFDTGGGTQRITQSLSTVASYAVSGTAPNFQGAIAVSEDRVEGTDIVIPTYQFTETHYLSDSTVNGAYKLTLFNLTGKVNDASFKGFAAGECLFLGATGTKRGDLKWQLTFRFAASPNVASLALGPLTGITKAGWDYLWVRYADFADGTAKTLVKRPIAAYVERVYARADFSTLGIGI